jgi:uncharacterized protein (TIGR03435 family)
MRFSPILGGLLMLIASGPPVARGQFDVTSVKPNRTGSDGSTLKTLPGGKFVATNANLKALIQFAFGIRDFQIIGGPRRLGTDAFDVLASTGSAGDLSEEQLRPALQALLAERFQLKFHRDMRELPTYSLTIARNGPKLTEHTGDGGPSGRTLFSGGKATLTAAKVPASMLAEQLGHLVERPVVDNTGLRGLYDFKLEWSPDQAAGSAGPSIFTAVQEQLGLKLESTRGPVEVIVIDSAEKPSEN